jgi:hypothetical protein
MHEKALNWACIPYISLVLNAKKIKILIVICHDEHDEIKVIIIIIIKYKEKQISKTPSVFNFKLFRLKVALYIIE